MLAIAVKIVAVGKYTKSLVSSGAVSTILNRYLLIPLPFDFSSNKYVFFALYMKPIF